MTEQNCSSVVAPDVISDRHFRSGLTAPPYRAFVQRTTVVLCSVLFVSACSSSGGRLSSGASSTSPRSTSSSTTGVESLASTTSLSGARSDATKACGDYVYQP